MKILFVIKMIDYGDYLPVCYLSSMAKRLNHETSLCILDDHDIFEIMEYMRPDVVAYSSNVLGHDQMVELNNKLKEKYDFTSIMGGSHPTYMPELFEKSGMDAFCIGEGELPFYEFLQRVESLLPFDDVPNLITSKGKNEIRRLVDLSSLPMPDRSLTLDNSGLGKTFKKSFFTSRGCPYLCSYCCNDFFKQLYKGKGKVVRRFPVDYVIAEMKSVREQYNMKFIKIGDDLFALKVDAWLEEFAERYKSEIGLPFNCYLRLDTVNKKLLALLRSAGCYSVHLSVDSVSEYVRNVVFNRKWKGINIKERIELIHSFGINTWVNFMVAAPESTLEDDLDAIRLSRRAKISHMSTSTTVPLKGTELWRYCVDRGYVNKEYEGQMDQCYEISQLKCFSEKEKSARHNVYNLGNLVAHLPFPLFQVGIFLIKHAPSNCLFDKLHDWYLERSVRNRIFQGED